jgi:hypothetical protein
MNAATVKRPTDQELADCKKALSTDQAPDEFLRTITEIGAKIATGAIWGNVLDGSHRVRAYVQLNK